MHEPGHRILPTLLVDGAVVALPVDDDHDPTSLPEKQGGEIGSILANPRRVKGWPSRSQDPRKPHTAEVVVAEVEAAVVAVAVEVEAVALPAVVLPAQNPSSSTSPRACLLLPTSST
jgi:hypothetical protein